MEDTLAEVQLELHEVKKRLEQLKVYEDWDMNYCLCEGCNRYTTQGDMYGEETDRCKTCVKNDKLCDENEKLRAWIETAKSMTVECYEAASEICEDLLKNPMIIHQAKLDKWKENNEST